MSEQEKYAAQIADALSMTTNDVLAALRSPHALSHLLTKAFRHVGEGVDDLQDENARLRARVGELDGLVDFYMKSAEKASKGRHEAELRVSELEGFVDDIFTDLQQRAEMHGEDSLAIGSSLVVRYKFDLKDRRK